MGAEETAGGNSGSADGPTGAPADGSAEAPAGDSAESTTGAPTEDPTDGAVAEAAELFVENGLWGYRTPEQVVVPPLYDCGFDFTEGLAAVRLGATWHYIDGAGRTRMRSREAVPQRTRPGRPRRKAAGDRPGGPRV